MQTRYLIVENSPRRLSKSLRIVVYVLMFLLGLAYFGVFFWYGTQEIELETQIEGRR